VEEADESQFWLEMFMHLEYGNKELLPTLYAESTEIVMVVTSIKDGHYSTKT
jgi:hypothetical protein